MGYIFLFIYTVGTGYLFEHSSLFKSRDKKNKRLKGVVTASELRRTTLYFLIVLPMILVHALRYGFGVDYTGTYKWIFTEAKLSGWARDKNNHIELGYWWLNKIVSLFTDDYVWALFWASVITLTILVIAIYRNSQMLTVSLALVFLSGFYFDATNVVRQEMATAFLLFSFKYIKEEKLLNFLVCIFLGSLFHNTVLIFLPFYFLKGVKMNKWQLLVIVGIAYLLRNIINSFVVQFVQSNATYGKYTNYLSEGRGVSPVYIFVAFSILMVFIVNVNMDSTVFIDAYFIYFTVITVVLSAFIPYSSRFTLYGLASYILVIPDMLKNIDDTKKLFAEIEIYSTLSLFILYIVFRANWYGAIPYISIFNR